jgi:O-antigen ligase
MLAVASSFARYFIQMNSHNIWKYTSQISGLSAIAMSSLFGLLLGIVALFVTPQFAIVGIFGLVFVALITYRPEIGLLTIVIITGNLIDFERLPLLSVGPVSFHITDLILLYLLTLVLIKALIHKSFHIVRTPLDIPILLFFFAVILSGFLAVTQYALNVNVVLRRVRALTYYLGFFCVTNLIRDKRQLRVLLWGLFSIAAFSSLMMLVQIIFPSIQLIDTQTVALVTAGQEYEGVARTYIAVEWLIYAMLLVSVCSLVFRSGWLPQSLEFLRIIILSVGLFLSFQRNYWLSMLAMLGLLGILSPWAEKLRSIRWLLVGLILIIMLISLSGNLFSNYIDAAIDRLVWGMQVDTLLKDSSTQMRVMETTYAFKSISLHPILGIGLGNLYRPLIEDDAYWVPEEPHIGLRWYIHNGYLWVWVKMGLIGLIPFLWIFGSSIFRGFKHFRKVQNRQYLAIVLGFTLALLGQAISNFVAPNYIQNWAIIIFAILMAINEILYKWELTEPVN